VTNARGEPAKDYTLIVFAADSKRWTPNSRYQRVARPDQDGRFKISSLPAGDYNIIAIDRVDPGQVTDPDFLQRVQPNAKSLFISEGETKRVDLRITTDLRD
jgi:hypothetical protein